MPFVIVTDSTRFELKPSIVAYAFSVCLGLKVYSKFNFGNPKS